MAKNSVSSWAVRHFSFCRHTTKGFQSRFIPANRLPGLHRDSFFPPGNPDAMARVMKATLTLPSPRTYDLTPYDWDEIARHTLKVYRKVLRR